MLDNLRIPQTQNDYHFSALRSKLLHNFFTGQRQYIVRYHWAASVAVVLFIALAVTFIIPNFAEKVNTFVFGDDNKELPVVVENTTKSKGILADSDNSITVKNSDNMITDDKTYLIRQYRSSRAGKVMLVSEYNKQPQNNKIRQTSASCY